MKQSATSAVRTQPVRSNQRPSRSVLHLQSELFSCRFSLRFNACDSIDEHEPACRWCAIGRAAAERAVLFLSCRATFPSQFIQRSRLECQGYLRPHARPCVDRFGVACDTSGVLDFRQIPGSGVGIPDLIIMTTAKNVARSWVHDNLPQLSDWCMTIWDFGETAWREYRSAAFYVDLLRRNGFAVEPGERRHADGVLRHLGERQRADHRRLCRVRRRARQLPGRRREQTPARRSQPACRRPYRPALRAGDLGARRLPRGPRRR